MQKAKTIRDIYRVFKPEEFLSEKEKELYVDVFADDMGKISDRLEWSENEQETIFIAGQPGNGKSTALRLLPVVHNVINQEYDIHYLNGRDKFDAVNRIDAIDVVLLIGFLFANKTPKLRDEYIKKLEELKSKKIGELQKLEESLSSDIKHSDTSTESGFKIDLNFLKIGIDFEDNFRHIEETKTTARKLLKSKKRDFLDITNEIIKKYQLTLKGNKKILLIVDDIEKQKDSDDIFTHDIGTLLELKCNKIITMPIHLKRKHAFAGQTAIELSIKLKEKSKDDCIGENIKLLEEIIKNRIDKDFYDSFIRDDAVKKIVLMSGGNLRQLISLVKESALSAKGSEVITLQDVESAIYSFKKQYSSATKMMDEFLKYIQKHHKPENFDDENIKLLAKATRNQMIFAYHNNESWYDINPIVANKEPCKIQ